MEIEIKILEETHHKMTMEAFEDIEAGNIISHEDMKVWAVKLRAEKNK